MHGAPGKAGQQASKVILNHFELEYPTPSDFQWAMQQMERLRLSHGVGINDCQIAAVAYRLQVPVYTHNVKDMVKLLGKNLVLKPY